MPSSISSPADVVNLALVRIGYKGTRIGNLYDGSAPSKKALDIYAQTRDAVLRQFDWGFAERIVVAALSGVAAPSPWSVSYAYPPDCMRLRNMFSATYLADKNNPLPNLYTIANDAAVGRIILCNLAGATLVYTTQVTDPTRWEPLFVETMAIELGKRLAPALAGLEAVKMEAEDEKVIVPLAQGTIG